MIQAKFCKNRIVSLMYGKRNKQYREQAVIPDDDVLIKEMRDCVEEKLDGIWFEDVSKETDDKNAICGFFSFPTLREYYVTKEHIKEMREKWVVRLEPHCPSLKHRQEFLYNGE